MRLAAANGEVECLRILKQFNAKYFTNHSGNFPIRMNPNYHQNHHISYDLCIDWAVQNQKLEAAQYLIDNFDVDMLAKNSYGRSVLTDAFQSGNTDVIALCLSHPTANEERLLNTDGCQEVEGSDKTSEGVTHTFDFTLAPTVGDLPPPPPPPGPSSHTEDGTSCSSDGLTLLVRELVISRADNPFGNDTSPQDDTTGTPPPPPPPL